MSKKIKRDFWSECAQQHWVKAWKLNVLLRIIKLISPIREDKKVLCGISCIPIDLCIQHPKVTKVGNKTYYNWYLQ